MGFNFTHAGDTTEVVAYVSPNKARFFTLSAEHFFGVGDIYIDVRTVFFCVVTLLVIIMLWNGLEWLSEMERMRWDKQHWQFFEN